MGRTAPSTPAKRTPGRDAPKRWVFFALAWFFFSLGLLGAFLPVLPTTPFMLLALWAFSKSSRRFHDWLYDHPVFGPRVRAYSRHRVIPFRVKLTAYAVMIASLAYVILVAHLAWPLVAIMGGVMAVGAVYIARCPSRVPGDRRTPSDPNPSELPPPG
jgi:uncharacterized membrane protein YbaN (DUF454 family)